MAKNQLSERFLLTHDLIYFSPCNKYIFFCPPVNQSVIQYTTHLIRQSVTLSLRGGNFNSIHGKCDLLGCHQRQTADFLNCPIRTNLSIILFLRLFQSFTLFSAAIIDRLPNFSVKILLTIEHLLYISNFVRLSITCSVKLEK